MKFIRYFLRFTGGFFLAWFLFFSLPSSLFQAPKSLVLYDRNNQLLFANVAADEQWRFPKIESVNDKIEKTVLCYEDEYFHYHPGINPISIVKSFLLNIKVGEVKRGGSTITMQTIRLLQGNPPRTYFQKVKEIFLALKMELTYSKKDILKYYVSNAPYGGNIVGIEAASWRYYSKSIDALSWAEAATLAVLPNQPSYIYPGKNQKKLLAKRNTLLKKLRDKNYLDNLDYQLALEEPLPQRNYAIPSLAYHLSTQIAEEERQGIVHTTIDGAMQKSISNILEAYHTIYKQNLILNLSAVVIDAQTSEILAYVGNTSDTVAGNKVDMIRRPRSSGSTLKPFLYAQMLDGGYITPNSLLQDIPIDIRGYEPQNSSHRFDGVVPSHQALARSLNIPWILALKKYGYEKFYRNLKEYGFKHFNQSAEHYGLSLVVGGGEVELLELANGFLQLSQSLEAKQNNRWAYFQKDKIGDNVNPLKLSQASIWLTFEALTNVVRPENEENWTYRQSQKIAWKTGTSHGFRDAWAVGANPNYVIAVWVGNADGNGRSNLTGIKKAAPILFDILNTLPQKRQTWYRKPTQDLKWITVCKESGLAPNNYCLHKTKIEIPQAVELREKCPYHKSIYLDATKQYQVNKSCYPEDSIRQASWFSLPLLEESYYRIINPLYRVLPPFHPSCGTSNKEDAMQIIFPKPNAHIIRHQSDFSNQIILQAVHRNSEAKIHWFVDKQFLQTTFADHKVAVTATHGLHRLTIQDNLGNMQSIRFTVE